MIMKVKLPLFSIITICKNSEKTIHHTIESVLNQTFTDYEYIIIDGKSTDGTLDIIKKYEPEFNGKLKWISEEDDGIYYAMNKGIKMASGDIVGIINSDDWYERNTLEIILKEYKKNKNSIFYGLLKVWKNEKEKYIYSNYYKNLPQVMIQHPTMFVPKKIYKKYGLYDIFYKVAADYDFCLRLFYNNIKFIQIEKLIANFRLGGFSLKNTRKTDKEVLKIKKSYNILSKKEIIKIRFKQILRYIKQDIIALIGKKI